MSPNAGSATLDTVSTPPRLRVTGDWTLAHLAELYRTLSPMFGKLDARTAVDFGGLGELDTAGAGLLSELVGTQRLRELAREAADLSAARRALIETVCEAVTVWRQPMPRPSRQPAVLEVLSRIGGAVENVWGQQRYLLGFIGLTLETLARNLFHPRRWRLTPLTAHIEQTGMDAIPIVALLTFMVGAVVAFLGATVLRDFGATVYTVNLVGFSFLREFGVLLTAILMAGRTASAFTAQIGAMKANEEIDAIRALGLDPMELLVLPRVLALLVSLPMLTFIAMIAGIVGGGLVCAAILDIPPVMFLGILKSDVGVQHFLLGLAKAPVFAFLIAVIGCIEGLKVSGSAQSVGEHTTSSVVQSIFMVILVDAVAALFYMEMGW
ncbi:ABC transporter permease [Frateuria defendens]|uniref:ABC transporter permease n=1 Tax=Frateuria defendens TaxID=2219559 RepID=UPI00066FF8A0|nr:ABC transporter permease [Frateuria defendens]